MKRNIIPYNLELKELARKLRNNSTPREIALWKILRNRQFCGYDFHRQKPLLNYIVDFYCYELNLVIELDGRYHNHDEKHNKDISRDAELQLHNLTVLRFDETEVMSDLTNVIRTIEAYILEHNTEEQTQEGHTPGPSREGKNTLY